MSAEITFNSKKVMEWRNEQGELHRECGPAVIYANGDYEYYLDGKLHRAEGPAVRWTDEDGDIKTEWYWDGKLHRAEGPAVEYKSFGFTAWYIHGREIPMFEYRAAKGKKLNE